MNGMIHLKQQGNEPVIEIDNLKKSFGNQEVLTDVSLKLFNGENLVVVGKSGTGKSVLIKCIVGLLNSDGGTINVFQKKINDIKQKRIWRTETENRVSFSEWCII